MFTRAARFQAVTCARERVRKRSRSDSSRRKACTTRIPVRPSWIAVSVPATASRIAKYAGRALRWK